MSGLCKPKNTKQSKMSVRKTIIIIMLYCIDTSNYSKEMTVQISKVKIDYIVII